MKSDLEGMRAVGYCRVSTDDKGQTNETQVRAIEEWAKIKGVTLVKIYQEEITGTTLDRPELERCIGRIHRGDIQILVALDTSRLTRDMKIAEIKEMIKGTNCQIRFVLDDGDPDSVATQITTSINQIMDKRENDVRKEKTRMGMETRKLAGFSNGRPKSFIFTEDIPNAPKGAYINPNDPVNQNRKVKTKTLSKEYILSFADLGYSLNYVAEFIIGIKERSFTAYCKNEAKYENRSFWAVYNERYTNALIKKKIAKLEAELSELKKSNDILDKPKIAKLEDEIEYARKGLSTNSDPGSEIEASKGLSEERVGKTDDGSEKRVGVQ